ncbi:MAG: branched-chain amino acid ABC transporter permease [Caldilinea sp.]
MRGSTRNLLVGVIYVALLGGLLWLAQSTLNNYYLRILAVIGINIILTVSLNLTNGFVGDFSLGIAAFMAVGAYTAALLSLPVAMKTASFPGLPMWLQLTSIPFLPATIAGGLLAAGVAAVVGIPVLRLRGHYLAVATLGLMVIVRIVANNWQDVTRGARGINGLPPISNIWWTFGWAVVTIYVVWMLINSPYGRAMVSIREDWLAAQARGMHIFRTRMLAFTISAFFAGCAGALWAHLITAITPSSFSFAITFNIVVMLVVGGMGSITGSVIAAALLTLLPEGLRQIETALASGGTPVYGLSQIIIALLAALVMIFRRQGLFGGKELRLPGMVERD